MMESFEYWEERAILNEEYASRAAKTTINKKLYRYYSKSKKDLDARIKRILAKYAADNKISEAEARKLLSIEESQGELDALRKELAQIKDPEIKGEALKRINAPAYRARITRLEAVKANIEAEQALLADRAKRTMKSVLNNVYKHGYYHNIYDLQRATGLGFDFAMLSDKAINTIINEKWAGDSFSRRIWLDANKTAREAYNIITRGIITGETIVNMGKQLEDVVTTSQYMAMRLIRTECNRVHNEANLAAYKEEGAKRYRFVATLDKVTCKVCADMDGKTFDVEEARKGKNFPPLHPNDRCTTVAELPDDVLKSLKRRARDPETGQVSKVPANMTYKEWFENYNTNK